MYGLWDISGADKTVLVSGIHISCFPTYSDLSPKPSSDAVVAGVVAGAVALVIAVGGIFIAILLLTRRQKRNSKLIYSVCFHYPNVE